MKRNKSLRTRKNVEQAQKIEIEGAKAHSFRRSWKAGTGAKSFEQSRKRIFRATPTSAKSEPQTGAFGMLLDRDQEIRPRVP